MVDLKCDVVAFEGQLRDLDRHARADRGAVLPQLGVGLTLVELPLSVEVDAVLPSRHGDFGDCDFALETPDEVQTNVAAGLAGSGAAFRRTIFRRTIFRRTIFR